MPEIQAASLYGNKTTELVVNSDDTDATFIAAPGAAYAHYLHDIYIYSDAAGVFTLKYTKGGSTVTKVMDFAASSQGGQVRMNVETDANTAITYTADGSTNNINVTLSSGLVAIPT